MLFVTCTDNFMVAAFWLTSGLNYTAVCQSMCGEIDLVSDIVRLIYIVSL